jgi:GTP-binding protein EngB required for normal cell division
LKEKYLNILEKLERVGEEFDFNNENIKNLKEKIKKTELTVPIIGAFNSGKSTLINKFLNQNILPTAITPETSLATEIRFNEIEKIEAIKEDGIEEFKINEFEEIKKRSKEFKYTKLYLSNENLKEIEPFILVDMPGFNSPISLHNKAIIYYLQKGVHFIVLINAEDGGISKTLLREIENILEFNADVSIMLSKTDLIAKNEVLKIKEFIEKELENELNLKKEVLIDKSLKEIILSLNINEIYKRLFLDKIYTAYFEIESRLNSYKNSLKNSIEENVEEIKKLEKAIEKLKKQNERMLERVRERYSYEITQNIVNAIINEIVLNQERIISLTLKDKNAVERELNEIIRNKLIIEIKKNLEKISDSIIEDFRIEIENLDFEIEDTKEWINEILNNSKRMLHTTNKTLEAIAENLNKSSKIYKTITTILSVATNILNPILEIAIIFLPEIINFFVDNEEKAKEKLRKKFKSEIIPTLKIKLTSKVDEITTKEIRLMIEAISNQLEEEFRIKQEEIQKAIEEKEKTKEEKEKIIEKIETVKKELQKEIKNF